MMRDRDDWDLYDRADAYGVCATCGREACAPECPHWDEEDHEDDPAWWHDGGGAAERKQMGLTAL